MNEYEIKWMNMRWICDLKTLSSRRHLGPSSQIKHLYSKSKITSGDISDWCVIPKPSGLDGGASFASYVIAPCFANGLSWIISPVYLMVPHTVCTTGRTSLKVQRSAESRSWRALHGWWLHGLESSWPPGESWSSDSPGVPDALHTLDSENT